MKHLKLQTKKLPAFSAVWLLDPCADETGFELSKCQKRYPV